MLGVVVVLARVAQLVALPIFVDAVQSPYFALVSRNILEIIIILFNIIYYPGWMIFC